MSTKNLKVPGITAPEKALEVAEKTFFKDAIKVPSMTAKLGLKLPDKKSTLEVLAEMKANTPSHLDKVFDETDGYPSGVEKKSNGSYTDFMTYLYTKDGRKIGNALVISADPLEAMVLTEGGLRHIFDLKTLIELFHEPEWVYSYFERMDWVTKRGVIWADLPVGL
jgi:hypothetical protein